jgi:hypothetical protein
VESGEHLLNCLAYVDLYMVRAGVVEHPADWEWCGWREVTGLRTRYRVFDLDGLAESLRRRCRRELAEAYERVIEQEMAEGLAPDAPPPVNYRQFRTGLEVVGMGEVLHTTGWGFHISDLNKENGV